MARKKKNADLITALGEQSDTFLACRDMRHAWQWQTDYTPSTVGAGRKARATVVRSLICTRCKTVRYDEYALPDFDRVKSTYTYPDNYVTKGHTGHIPVASVRGEIVSRLQGGTWTARVL